MSLYLICFKNEKKTKNYCFAKNSKQIFPNPAWNGVDKKMLDPVRFLLKWIMPRCRFRENQGQKSSEKNWHLRMKQKMHFGCWSGSKEVYLHHGEDVTRIQQENKLK